MLRYAADATRYAMLCRHMLPLMIFAAMPPHAFAATMFSIAAMPAAVLYSVASPYFLPYAIRHIFILMLIFFDTLRFSRYAFRHALMPPFTLRFLRCHAFSLCRCRLRFRRCQPLSGAIDCYAIAAAILFLPSMIDAFIITRFHFHAAILPMLMP